MQNNDIKIITFSSTSNLRENSSRKEQTENFFFFFLWTFLVIFQRFLGFSKDTSLEFVVVRDCEIWFLIFVKMISIGIVFLKVFYGTHENNELKNEFTLLAGVCLSRLGDTTTSCPVCSDPTGVDCGKRRNRISLVFSLLT